MKSVEEQNLNSLGIYISFNEENIREATAMIIGPKGSLYEDGFLFFHISFPRNYPYSPPDVSYIPRNRIRIHPNIYVGNHPSGNGKVCLSILGTWSGPKWTSVMDISSVLLTIQSLLDNNPLHHEPGQENNIGNINYNYNKTIEYNTVQSLIMKNVTDIPVGFEEFKEAMISHFRSNKDSILGKLSFWETKDTITCTIPFYRINHTLDYKKTYSELKKITI